MSDIAKWALLAAAIVGFIAMIASLGIIPDSSAINGFASSLTSIVAVCGDAISMARGFINVVLPSWAVPVFSIVITYIIGRPVLLFAYRTAVKTIHYIYK